MIVALVSLVVTLLVEVTIGLLLGRVGAVRTQRGRLCLDITLVNLATHPLATLAVGNLNAPFAAVEVLVVGAELLAYRAVTRLSWGQAMLLSVVTNGVTVALSLMARA